MTSFPVPPLPRYMPDRQGRPMPVPPSLMRSMEQGARIRAEQAYGQAQERMQKLEPPTPQTTRLAMASSTAPRIPWDVFITQHFKWDAGQHIGMIGPTGQGKTTMLFNILPLKPYVVLFATKPADDNMDALIDTGYLKMERWQSIDPDQFPRRVLWPNANRLGAAKRQQEVFHDAFERIYLERGWTVAIDELWYIINILKLSMDVRTYLLQARALGISLVCATQRPSAVPLEIYDQSTHLFFWKDNDRRNLDRITGIASHSEASIRHLVSNLEEFQVLYINVRTGAMVRTKCPKIKLLEGG